MARSQGVNEVAMKFIAVGAMLIALVIVTVMLIL